MPQTGIAPVPHLEVGVGEGCVPLPALSQPLVLSHSLSIPPQEGTEGDGQTQHKPCDAQHGNRSHAGVGAVRHPALYGRLCVHEPHVPVKGAVKGGQGRPGNH
jgi:hypothetical protein